MSVTELLGLPAALLGMPATEALANLILWFLVPVMLIIVVTGTVAGIRSEFKRTRNTHEAAPENVVVRQRQATEIHHVID